MKKKTEVAAMLIDIVGTHGEVIINRTFGWEVTVYPGIGRSEHHHYNDNELVGAVRKAHIVWKKEQDEKKLV